MSSCEGCKKPEEVKFTVNYERFRGVTPEVTIARFYIELDGVTMELHKTVGCDRHMVSADHKRHFCIGENNTIHELSPQKTSWFCGEVCDYKKKALKQELDAHGKWMTEDTVAAMRSYIESKNTVGWE